MPVVNTLSRLSIPSGGLQLGPKGLGIALKPLTIGAAPLCDLMADVKRDAGKGVSALFADFRAALPALTR